MKKIEAALTPEEWEDCAFKDKYADELNEPRCSATWWPRPGVPAAMTPELDVQGYGFQSGGKNLHALAALCLHGQPFGFTWEDVRVLREQFHVNLLQDLADRIAALLPPEETS